MTPVLRMCEVVGTWVTGWCLYAVDATALVGQAVGLLARPSSLPPVARTVLQRQILFTGVEAMPFTALLALLTSVMVVVQAQAALTGIGTSDLFNELLVAILVRGLGPLLVALVVLARSGTAMATELGSMQVRGEVAALERQGIDPFRYLVVPRLGGAAVAVACLTLQYIVISLAGGYFLPRLFDIPGAPDLSTYLGGLARHLGPGDLVGLLAKTLIPGALIAAIACREGLACATSFTAVPQAATRAVVRSLVAVFLWNALVTIVLAKA
jgi:phospholipid/cholesterol/gamma-HCH transport system permease protein